ncbi:pyridoxal 5'-phosphate synthase-like subunit PDX1.2 [Cucumis melo var. makuwa]|uniref:Pyridoxal 5'-phosphate synthase-like subunit PDX1.2 n=1 Tax=Cucumis melo var. makuwa TaxID=1194695 RepID=A0A5D3BYT2_CUCMM|nr:pyridoxal 5'-phosphate synthase-like subunit PDX1.2 [Cucumis melo var. makuwa]TYK04032.1 pyridoxal 5'-phosphate synthase-like subunit PDX1.2 [Cucumis melo var. makuwa]
MPGESSIAPFAANGNTAFGFKERPNYFKKELARIHRGVIVEVKDVYQAKIAEEAGACCVLFSQQIFEGTSQIPDPLLFKEMTLAVSIPIIVKIRIGHFVEAQILDCIGVRHFDESDEASAVDDENFINKHKFKDSYFVCGSRSLGEALRRIKEGAAIVKTLGNMGSSSGNISETLRNVRAVMSEIRYLHNMDEDEVFAYSQKIDAPYDLVKETRELGRLPGIYYAAGGIVTPADAALMMQLGCDGIFLALEIFECPNPRDRLRRMVEAVRNHRNPEALVRASFDLAPRENRIEQSASVAE